MVTEKQVELTLSELTPYLKKYPKRPIYVVSDDVIISEMRWDGGNNSKVDVVNFTMFTKDGNPLEKEVSFDSIEKMYLTKIYEKKTKSKAKLQYYTAFGLNLMIDVWEKTGT